MTQLSKSAFLAKWTPLFADNDTGDITEEMLRNFTADIKDSFNAELEFETKVAASTSLAAALALKYDASNPSSYLVLADITAALVTGKLLTGLPISGGPITSAFSILQALGSLQNQINSVLGGMSYQGAWNASTNSPTLASGVGTNGFYYVVDTPGVTNLDGINDWELGDWAAFNGTTWEKIDNTDAVISVNGNVGVITLTKADLLLGNVDNTSDINKIVSNPTQTALNLKSDIIPTVSAGTVVAFDKDRDYGSEGSPETGNISYTTTGAQVGVISRVIHNHTSAPTFAANMVAGSNSGTYVTSTVNYIVCEYRHATLVKYWISQ